MQIEIGVNGRGIVITTIRKREEYRRKAFNEGFEMARDLFEEE